MAARTTPLLWRYSVRWGLPHKPCPGEVVLASAEVPEGMPCPESVKAHWRPGTGYCISLDFQQSAAVRRWSDEQRAKVRRRNLIQRIEKTAPLFADELIARELDERREYFSGKRIGAESD